MMILRGSHQQIDVAQMCFLLVTPVLASQKPLKYEINGAYRDGLVKKHDISSPHQVVSSLSEMWCDKRFFVYPRLASETHPLAFN